MELREFQIDVPGKGTVDVRFRLHFNDHDYSVTANEIKIHADFDSGLPRHPQLMFEDGIWKFHVMHPFIEDKEVVVKEEFLDDGLNQEIINRILAIMEDAKVK